MITISSIIQNVYSKRHFTPVKLIQYLAYILKYLPYFRKLSTDHRLPFPFQERIIMAVTAVNQCRYCSYYHTRVALEAGCSEQEIESILGSDFNCVEAFELPALAFAQHFAESRENPSRLAIKQLIRYYGQPKATQILMSCMMITFGNLFGNTVDAYETRRRGGSVENGNTWFEGLIYYLSIRVMKSLVKTEIEDQHSFQI